MSSKTIEEQLKEMAYLNSEVPKQLKRRLDMVAQKRKERESRMLDAGQLLRAKA